jgi:hypothetical protein
MKYDAMRYAGYTINFGSAVEKLMRNKNYKRVYDQNADFEVYVDARTLDDGLFQKAQTRFQILDYGPRDFSYQHSKRCFTQSCAISDFHQSFKKLFKKVDRKFQVFAIKFKYLPYDY